MNTIYLTSYSVKGIKSLEQTITLSFYKKLISANPNTQEYNVKGIYGMNGSGKSGIIASVDIFKNLLINPGYLNNPIVQKNLDAIINKNSGELYIEVEYIVKLNTIFDVFQYKILLSKETSGKYVVAYEELSSKKAPSKYAAFETIFRVTNGEVTQIEKNKTKEYANAFLLKTINLLSTASMSALFLEKHLNYILNHQNEIDDFYASLITLFLLGHDLHVYMDASDDHRNYFVQNNFDYLSNLYPNNSNISDLMRHFFGMRSDSLNIISVSDNIVNKTAYERFEKIIDKLCEFLQVFKSDLQKIEIDKKENQDVYVCNLIMVYNSYKIDAEFESTGIKKLIRLFAYLREMSKGGIVFIDELDSNLHDVYLCALLEYLMEYGKGQLCFTTHNVGPMDILRYHKKSIDFLSEDHKIYSWTTNGNYSPSKLYRSGMIEGSPFNVDSIDFIGVLGSEAEDN